MEPLCAFKIEGTGAPESLVHGLPTNGVAQLRCRLAQIRQNEHWCRDIDQTTSASYANHLAGTYCSSIACGHEPT